MLDYILNIKIFKLLTQDSMKMNNSFSIIKSSDQIDQPIQHPSSLQGYTPFHCFFQRILLTIIVIG